MSMVKHVGVCWWVLLVLGLAAAGSCYASRIKDIADIKGVRSNELIGYGLVVGLNGSGDSESTGFTNQSLANMMQRMGMTVSPEEISVDNIAAVVVTAKLPPFAQPGNTVDATVSSIGDADSLIGGTLLMTPLKGPDGNVYAVAQGALTTNAIAFGGKAAEAQKNHPTVGRVPNGATVEKKVDFKLPRNGQLTYQLKRNDFTTATRMAEAINKHFGQQLAQPQNGRRLQVKVPQTYQGRTVNFISQVEKLNVTPDTPARVVVNERTGTIVMGHQVRISKVAVSHGNLSLVISEESQVSQPQPLGQGETETVPRTQMQVSEEPGSLVVMDKGVNISQVAQALNAIGATPRDLIAIFQAIKASGSLHAELVVL